MRTCLVCLLWLSCSRKEKEAGITTSSLPGTTLDFIKLGVGKGVALVDTPGLILSHQLTSSLLSDELKAVFPERSIEEVTLRVGEGKSVMLGGLARMEFVEGLPFFFTFFVVSVAHREFLGHHLVESPWFFYMCASR